MPAVRVDTGVTLYYERHGVAAGDPVVFVRGTGADSSRWMPQVEAYRERYACLIFDNRGVGQSETTPRPYTVEMLADDTLALLDALGVEQAHFSGLSLGGCVVQALALKAPERVRTLQLHGTWGRTTGYARMYLGMLKRLVERGGLDLYYDTAILYLFPPQWFIDNEAEADRILAAMKANSSPAEGLLGQLDANMTHDLLDRLGEIAAPTLITCGELDMCLPPHYSRELQAAIPNSEYVEFPGGSHLFGIQDPATFNNVTLTWLDRQAAGA